MNNGFQIVKSKRKRREDKKVGKQYYSISVENFDPEVLFRKTERTVGILKQTTFHALLFSSIPTTVDNIICLGLGNFSLLRPSHIQLAALLSLQQHFKVSIQLYDPVFSPLEKSFLSSLGISLLTENNEGKIVVQPNRKTLAFFPHCPKQLVNNFLWANWGPQLSECVIISNSFSTIITNNTNKTLGSISCIRDILSITNELSLEECCEYPNVFNDLSTHTFQTEKVAPEFWKKREAPVYEDDIEFITQTNIVEVQDIQKCQR